MVGWANLRFEFELRMLPNLATASLVSPDGEAERAKSSPLAAEETLALGCGLNEKKNLHNSVLKVIPRGILVRTIIYRSRQMISID